MYLDHVCHLLFTFVPLSLFPYLLLFSPESFYTFMFLFCFWEGIEIFIYLRMCVCIHTWVGPYACVYMRRPEEGGRYHPLSFVVPTSQDLFLTLGMEFWLCRKSASPAGTLVSASFSAGVTDMGRESLACFVLLGSELRAVWLWSNCP